MASFTLLTFATTPLAAASGISLTGSSTSSVESTRRTDFGRLRYYNWSNMYSVTMSLGRALIGAVFALSCASLTLAHIRIAPVESVPGAREKYTMRVPNEKQVASIRVEFVILGINPTEARAWCGTSASK
jgi:hypothetical protein